MNIMHRPPLDLVVDTSCSRHQGNVPTQVFPHEHSRQDLGLAALRHVRSFKTSGKAGLRQLLESRLHIPVRPVAAQRSVSDSTQVSSTHYADSTIRPALGRGHTAAPSVPISNGLAERGFPPAPHLDRRIQGLRPSPLDLVPDFSPSDRAITIGIALPASDLTELNAGSEQTKVHPSPARQSQYATHGGRTPMIVITPARETFGLSMSPDAMERTQRIRPASSVYSRYIDGDRRYYARGGTPPIPPMPLCVEKWGARAPATMSVERDPSHKKSLSICTTFEEDLVDLSSHSVPRRTVSQSPLPTPRRSRGWWNVITSPFSAGSKMMWRSPMLQAEDDDSQPILRSASALSGNDRSVTGDELRSAPAGTLQSDRVRDSGKIPQRSATAPSILSSGRSSFDIYRIPSQGEASAYYNPAMAFSSAVSDAQHRSSVESMYQWSPSDSVARQAYRRDSLGSVPQLELTTCPGCCSSRSLHPSDAESARYGDQEDPFAEEAEDAISRTGHACNHTATYLPASQRDEGKEVQRPVNERSITKATMTSLFSLSSPSPVLENAHVAQLMDPHSAEGGLRTVDLTPALAPTMVRSISTPVATHDTSAASLEQSNIKFAAEKAYLGGHSRNGSYGLGIYDSEKAPFPTPQPLASRPRLGTDKFGQLRVVTRNLKAAKPTQPWYRRFFWMLATFIAILIVSSVVLLVMLIPQGHSDMAVQANWMNLTAYPPMPTGIMTVIQPRTKTVIDGCVTPPDLWTCASPADQSVSGQESQPDFRFEVRFRAGIVPSKNITITKRSGGAARATDFVRRDEWSNALFVPTPHVPSMEDQTFLGRTTDNVTTGESTPFYLSILDPSNLGRTVSVEKRHNAAYPYPTPSNTTSKVSSAAAHSIPPPFLEPDGRPARAEMYPMAEAQPLRLFNRGLADEYYGMYLYFDRSLYTKFGDQTATRSVAVPLDNATAVCTWSQTRMRVQIWTRRNPVSPIDATSTDADVSAINSTANDMKGPGSFPYAVTITLDRHGGDASKKGVHCYGIDQAHHVIESTKTWIEENRSFGGQLVHPAAVPGTNIIVNTRRAPEGFGGIDGGSGGCACAWETG